MVPDAELTLGTALETSLFAKALRGCETAASAESGSTPALDTADVEEA